MSEKPLSLLRVARMADAEIAEIFAQARWGENGGEPVCPWCECDCIYELRSEGRYKCIDCKKKFSLTSGTALANHKATLQTVLLAVVLLVSGAKGMSSLQLSKTIGCQFKTIFVLIHKIRETLLAEQSRLPLLTGHVEIDGAFFGGHTENFQCRSKLSGKMKIRYRFADRRVVVVARQRQGRTLTCVVDKESDALPFLKERISKQAIIHADLGHGWDAMQELFQMLRVNHKEGYFKDGACTNHCESFFALLRRKQMGLHHRMSGANLELYAAELAWRNDHKRVSQSDQVKLILREIMTQPPSQRFTGYWQGQETDPLAQELAEMGLVVDVKPPTPKKPQKSSTASEKKAA